MTTVGIGPLYPACDCKPDGGCRTCVYANACPTCHVTDGSRCVHPSGHRGPLIAAHDDRYVLGDVDALVLDPIGVVETLAAAEPEARPTWRRNLRKLRRHERAWRGKVPEELLDALVDLATDRPAPPPTNDRQGTLL